VLPCAFSRPSTVSAKESAGYVLTHYSPTACGITPATSRRAFNAAAAKFTITFALRPAGCIGMLARHSGAF
jgi:hypothetical protein